MSSTSVKVAVRVRPMAAKELLANSSECVEIIPGTQQIIVGGGPSGNSVGSDTVYQFTQKSFTFDYLFDENTTQEDLYTRCVGPLVDRFLEGFNATILAYGQTGSGKTYSMGIGLDGINPNTDVSSKGIVPRSISVIFERLAQQKDQDPDFQSSVTVSFMELYNEELIDLLNPRPRTASTVHNGPTIREDGSGKIVWQNLSEEAVTSTVELMGVLQKGTLCRTTGSTDMNASSSRSHAIFTVTLKQTRYVEMEEGQKEKSSLVSKFHFVDLAGSERLKRTNAEGDRKKEGISINQGLLALGNVISALGDETRKTGHVPYRDSKLTRMLQDSLGGNSQTFMLACISPSDLNYGETVNTLHYANRARNIKNRVAVNQDWGGTASGETMREIKALRATISQLRTEIAMIRANGVPTEGESLAGAPQTYHQRRERDQLAEIENLKTQLQNQSFQIDKYHFCTLRLIKKVQQLLEENAQLAIQRDTAIADKCHLLSEIAKNGNISNISEVLGHKKQRRSRENSEEIEQGSKRSRSPSLHESKSVENVNMLEETRAMITKYVKIIGQLRLQLSQSEDKLAWQYEAMSKLGKKGGKSRAAWNDSQLVQLGVNPIPAFGALEIAREAKEEPNLKAQRKVLEAIRENIELRTGKELPSTNMLELHDTMVPEHLTEKVKSGSWLKYQFTGEHFEEESGDLADDELKGDSDLFILINSIQNDIERHQNLMERNQKREAEYEKMQKAYEQKLKVLQNQMAQFQKERDLALQKITTGSKQQRTDAAIKYDEAKRKLDMEINDTRRKMGENSRMQSFNKARSDKLTSELQATINALKAEKNRMLQELRMQTQKHRDENTNNMREISKLKRKEKNATEALRRLERSNQLQRLMLKKRNEEVVRSQNKLKQIMRSLKRAATPNKVMKSQFSSGFTSPVPGSRHGRRGNGPSMNEMLASVNSPVRVSVSHSFTDSRPEDIDLQAQFKKQMVDKELACTISCRRSQKELEKLKECRMKLVEEQKELIAERRRVVEAHFQATGIYDEKSPQYMDERVQSIDLEVASIDSTITQLEDQLKRNTSIVDEDSISSYVDLSWENALNILRALDRVELEATVSYFLEDVVLLRSQEEELQQELEDKEKAVEALQSKLFDAQESLFQAIQDAKKTLEKKSDLLKDSQVQTNLSSEIIVDEIESDEELPKYDPKLRPKEKENVDDVAALPVRLIERLSRPKSNRNLSMEGSDSRQSVSPMPDDFVRGRPLQSRNSVEKLRNRSGSPTKEKPPAFLAPIKKEETLIHQSSMSTLKLDDEMSKPKKKYDLLTMGSDVFKRLANAHTQASQAKVIQRTSIDKDSLMQEPLALTEPRRKSIAELEQNWNMDTT